jgi:hypothetical protein
VNWSSRKLRRSRKYVSIGPRGLQYIAKDQPQLIFVEPGLAQKVQSGALTTWRRTSHNDPIEDDRGVELLFAGADRPESASWCWLL